ncbi:hypothetical protein MSAN_02479100 [Mycena sanguinolenta]|uniref:DUF6533 domain-containing protein n=1 Tax=Mycena sanguinolenta TaxID=230812 RepID=A0A8H6U295_9AGAR|nr:hypothetical protein MSAN_02479100 [Mycena sanguinolenta]
MLVTAELAADIRIHASLHLLGICLMYYDHLLTLDREIEYMWKRVTSSSALWFFAIRYAGFAGNIPVTIFTFYEPPLKWYVGRLLFLDHSTVIVSIVMVLRIHALYGRNIWVLAAVLATSLPLLVVVLWSTQGQRSDAIDNFPGCHASVSQSTFVYIAAAWEALFALDTILFLLVLCRTYATWRRTGYSTKLPIQTLILCDGVLYFGAIAVANLCNILTFYFAGPILAGSLSTFASCMSVTMMSRLMLNLHRQIKGDVLPLDSRPEESMVVFAQYPLRRGESHLF